MDILFPRRCPICDGVLSFGGALICPECSKKVLFVREPRCRKCGKMLSDEQGEYCGDCKTVPHTFDRGISLFLYNDAMRNSISRYKYGNRREYAKYYGETMAKYLGEEILSFRPEALLPVPLHKERLRKRGYNQAALIAGELGAMLRLPVLEDLVIRKRATRPQKMLDREERRKNLKRAFTLGRNDVKLNRVVLIDDIYTTGSTSDEIASVLKNSGVREVYVVALCSGTPM